MLLAVVVYLRGSGLGARGSGLGDSGEPASPKREGGC